jgi:DNA adenine methylase
MKSPISYYGGKQNLVNHILPMIPRHEQYGEVFFGGGAVFFAKEPGRNEFINDLDGRVTNFYRVAASSKTFPDLQDMILSTAHSEIEHRRSKQVLANSNSHTEIERAWAFWVQTNMSYLHAVGKGFAFQNDRNSAIATRNFKDNFTDQILKRLDRVNIFQRDAVDLINLKGHRPDAFFYVDPPYYNADCAPYIKYGEDDFQRLLEGLGKVKARFILSCYPNECLNAAREKAGWFSIEIEQANASKVRTGKRKTEVLTYNFQENQRKIF